jgi:hypothetical protein
MSAFTGGPWQSMHDYALNGIYTIIGNVDGEIIDGYTHHTYTTVAEVYDNDNRVEDLANARLIAAAPDMHDALERLLEVAEFAYMNAKEQPREFAAARAALAKVRGS